MAMTLITTNDDSDVATSDFTSSIDSTYKLYIFKWYDVNPATDSVKFGFQVNAVGESGYNETITSTVVQAYFSEAGSDNRLIYTGSVDDQANGTALQMVGNAIGNGGDESNAGELFLFNPSNTTYVKHFYTRAHGYYSGDYTWSDFVSGYINTTTAIDDVQFKMSSGNMDAVIKMYGVG